VIIDFHTHVRRGKGDVKEFIRAMDQRGIDMSVVLPIVPSPAGLGESTNEFVHELTRAYPDRLIGFACVLPTLEDAPAELERAVVDYKFRGLKLHPPIQNFSLLDPRIYPTIRKAVELDIPIIIHTGPIFARESRMRYAGVTDVDDLALIFPEATLVIAHGDPLGDAPVIAAKHPRVYMDTAIVFGRWCRLIPGLAEETMRWMRTSDKLIYGSDANPERLYRFDESLDPVKSMDVAEDAKANVLWKNAARLLKLNV
jgi:hypothetical protein